MNFSDPISRSKFHLAQITGGEWRAVGFTVKSASGQNVAIMQRAVDAAFVAESATIISMLLGLIAEARADAKKARYEVSLDRDQVTTLKDQLANACSRRDELQVQLEAAWAELDRAGRRK
jgi:hypothetical protein